jgi:hypothetical protein
LFGVARQQKKVKISKQPPKVAAISTSGIFFETESVPGSKEVNQMSPFY